MMTAPDDAPPPGLYRCRDGTPMTVLAVLPRIAYDGPDWWVIYYTHGDPLNVIGCSIVVWRRYRGGDQPRVTPVIVERP